MNEGRKITDLEQMESVPKGTSYLAEAGDGSGPRQLKHEKLVEEVGKGIRLGNLEELDTKEKDSIVAALNEVNKKTGTVFEGTDGIKEGTAGVVPAPKPEDNGYVLGANGKWVPPGEGGSMEVLEDMEELEANTDPGKLVDALVVKEINDSLIANDASFNLDFQNNQWGWNESPARGADTFHPFSSLKRRFVMDTLQSTSKFYYVGFEPRYIYIGYATSSSSWHYDEQIGCWQSGLNNKPVPVGSTVQESGGQVLWRFDSITEDGFYASSPLYGSSSSAKKDISILAFG